MASDTKFSDWYLAFSAEHNRTPSQEEVWKAALASRSEAPEARPNAAGQDLERVVPYGRLLQMLRWARKDLDDTRLWRYELDGRRRSETKQEHSDRISTFMQENEDRRRFLNEIDVALSAIDSGPSIPPLEAVGSSGMTADHAQGVQPGERGEGGDWYCEDHPEHLMGHDGCNGMGIIESARIPMFVALLKSARQHAREAEQFRDDVVAQVRNRLKRAACPKCAQTDAGQTGEYPCAECGLPTVWDAAPKSERGEG